MPENILTISEVIAYLREFQTNYNLATSLLHKGLTAGMTAWTRTGGLGATSFDITNRMSQIIYSKIGSKNLKSRNGLVEDKIWENMKKSLKELENKWTKINDAWAEHPMARAVTVAIVSWKDSFIGKYIFTAARYYLSKIKNLDNEIKASRKALNKLDQLKRPLSPDGEKIYIELQAQLKESEKALGDIKSFLRAKGVEVDTLLYETFGLAYTTKAIITMAIVITACAVIIAVVVIPRLNPLYMARKEGEEYHARQMALLAAEEKAVAQEIKSRDSTIKEVKELKLPPEEAAKLITETIDKSNLAIEQIRGEAEKERGEMKKPTTIGDILTYGLIISGVLGGAYVVGKVAPPLIAKKKQ